MYLNSRLYIFTLTLLCTFFGSVHGDVNNSNVTPATLAFQRYGNGDCVSLGRNPVRGRSRRDVSHGLCRSLCSFEECMGYSYAPCEQICTLHGDPVKLTPLPNDAGWSTVNGGGKIVNSTQLCGSACFVRKAPCPSSVVVSAGATVYHEAMTFGTAVQKDCPYPYKGSLELYCGLSGVEIRYGRCLRTCLEDTITDGQFEVKTPPTRHGELGVGWCPFGSMGNMTILCTDGEVKYMWGTCGYNCQAGSLRSGSAVIRYNALSHEASTVSNCPDGWVGQVFLQCMNTQVSIALGSCQKNCVAGQLYTEVSGGNGPTIGGYVDVPQLEPDRGTWVKCNISSGLLLGRIIAFCSNGKVIPDYTSGRCRRNCAAGWIGPPARQVWHRLLMDTENVTLPCSSGFHGLIEVSCMDGQASLVRGSCSSDCVSGTITSNGVTLVVPALKAGNNFTARCPTATHTGNISVVCTDGRFNMTDGFCGLNCSGGMVTSNGAVVEYTGLAHAEVKNFSCPAPWGAALRIWCYDGSIRWNGFCGQACQSGSIMTNGAIVRFPDLNHTEAGNYTCDAMFAGGSITFSGFLTVRCFNGKAEGVGDCYANCPPQNLRNGGTIVTYPFLLVGQEVNTSCAPRPAFGLVTVSCLLGTPQITRGSCGLPCPAGEFKSALTRFTPIDLDEIPHGGGIWKSCPQDLSGRVYITCRNGESTVSIGECGQRCESESVVVYGASFVSPMLDHADTWDQPCQSPFSGSVHLSCSYGTLNVSSECQKGCLSGSLVIPGGAYFLLGDMVSRGTVSPPCPRGFVGNVTLQCLDGNFGVFKGACFANCKAGRFQSQYYEVQYDATVHNFTTKVECPTGFVGSLQLLCTAGSVAVASGSCLRDCVPGNTFVRTGVVLSQGYMVHGTQTVDMDCPEGYIGSVRLQCTDSLTSVASGQCMKHCGTGLVQGAKYTGLLHDSFMQLVCPQAGSLRIFCFDGNVKVISGICLYSCTAGTVYDRNGVPVQHQTIAHNSTTNGTCSQLGVGSIRLFCNNSVVTILQGDKCSRNCAAQNVTWRPQSLIETPSLLHLGRVKLMCPNDLVGILYMACIDGTTRVIDGACGDLNCRSGKITSNGALLSYPDFNDGREEGPTSCPSPYQGQATFYCQKGVTSVLEVTAVVQPRFDGNYSSTGPDFPFIEDDRFLICGCCMPPAPQPAVSPVLGTDVTIILVWAGVAIGGGIILASISGYFIMKKRPFMKTSRVAPSPTSEVRALKLAALEDAPHALAIKDGSPQFAIRDVAAMSDPHHLALADVDTAQMLAMTTLSHTPHMPQRAAVSGSEWKHW